MGGILSISIKPGDMEHVRLSLVATQREYHKAERSTQTRVLSWARTQVGRGIAKNARVPIAALYGARTSAGGSRSRTDPRSKRAARIRTGKTGGSNRPNQIWIGASPMPAIYAGKASQTKAGSRVGSRVFPGAFLATMRSGHRGVYKREGQKRFGIIEQMIELAGAGTAVHEVGAKIPARLQSEFRRQLKYRVTGSSA